MHKKNIFRAEVFEQRLTSSLGPVLITLPVRVEYLSWLFLCLVLGMTAYLVFAPYSDHVLIPGYIDSDPGMAHVYPLRSGTVLRRAVQVGQWVKKGQTLLVVRTGQLQLAKPKQQVLHKLTQLEQSMSRDITQKKIKLHELSLLVKRHYLSRVEWAQFKKGLHEAQQQLAELSLRRMNLMLDQQVKVITPIDGKVMQIAADEGQVIRPDKVLVKVMPTSAKWLVTLLVPMSAIRFVKLNQRIQLRYDAYPYLQYGTAEAVVRAVSPVISTSDEQVLPIRTKQPFYQIQAALLFDTSHRLYQGMTLQAVLSTESRPLWRRLLRC